MAYFIWLKNRTVPSVRLPFLPVNIPTLAAPFVFLFLIALLVPNSSFIGHFISIVIGFIMANGYLAAFCNPPFKIVLRIEKLLDKLICQVSEELTFVREADVVGDRYKWEHIGAAGSTPLPLTEKKNSQNGFQGQGQVLGSSSEN
ncbi:unnamed protein product [Ambrosiozyma monospora]|uniref:Unnamed protein product n=1 Tax=Ambrosiozyma monospora TaxID=43982 RepID=A0A9W7DHG7_AMBMO|nr:unnamed protein product [Ambrosiozyma monospora]